MCQRCQTTNHFILQCNLFKLETCVTNCKIIYETEKNVYMYYKES